MIHKNGSLFDSKAGYFAHGVNCRGVMGAGIAALFKENFPSMYKAYRVDCLNGRVTPGNYDVIRENYQGREVMVVNLASQNEPGPDAQYDWLVQAVLPFAHRAMAKENVAKHGNVVAIPEIGCGIGGLEWPVVEEMLSMVESLTGITFEVWHYEDRAGNELEVGDEVLYIENQSQHTVHLVWGTIAKFTPQMVVFEVEKSYGTRIRRCPPNRVVKPFKEIEEW